MSSGIVSDIIAAFEADATPAVAGQFATLAADQYATTRDGAGRVSTALTPGELAARFDEPIPMGMRAIDDILARIDRDVLADANHLLHPMYVGHQVSAPLPAAAWTEIVVAALNNSLAVWEMSPTLTMLERRVISWMCELAGYGPEAGGTFTSGGTEATFSALLAARAALMPDAWEHGMEGPLPVVLCSEHTHYAVTRAIGEMGLGMRNAITVAADADYRMDPAALAATVDAVLASGRRVMAVVATAGQTATGAFDDLDAIADVCDAHGIWLHVDGAHGASALLSPTHRGRLTGLARARSLAWDPHKMMLMPLAAGMVLVRDRRDLSAAFTQRAPYLFHGAVDESPDLGTSSFLCSRRGDALKVWVALQRYGADGIGALYEHLCAGSHALHDRMLARDDFAPVHAPMSNILCFRWVGAEGEPMRALHAAAADRITDLVRARYNASGDGWLTVTTLGGQRVLRVTIMNPRTSAAHLDTLLDGLARVGAQLIEELHASPATTG